MKKRKITKIIGNEITFNPDYKAGKHYRGNYSNPISSWKFRAMLECGHVASVRDSNQVHAMCKKC